jgi:hypothetical protein
MPLNAEDVQSWDLPKLDKAIDEIRDNVASLREKNGGTLVGMKGADADTVRDAMQDLNLLGEARDGRREQEGNEQQFARLSEYMNEPDPERAVAHGNGKPKAEGPSDIGGMFIQSDAWKAFQTDGRLNVPARVPTSALFGRNFQGIGEIPGDQLRMQAATFDSSGFATRRDFRDDQLVDTLYQANNIGPLMPQGTTDSDTITYPVETVTATGSNGSG